MAQHVMISTQANPLLGPLEGVGPENRDMKWQRAERLPFWPQKVKIFRAHPF